MKNIILASTSTLYGGQYLNYLKPVVKDLFSSCSHLIFIPFARPNGISHDDYTANAQAFFGELGIQITGLHSFKDPVEALNQGCAFFTGGGNTFLLVKQLHDLNLMSALKENVENGKPYLGTSAGSNIAGINMKTTNDMPIIYPPSFETMGLVNFNLNPHYLDPNPDLKHNGETRETRIKEFHSQNQTPVVGLREGSWIKIKGEKITTEGDCSSRIFEQGKQPYEVDPSTDLSRLK